MLKQAIFVGGPLDGQTRTVDVGLTALYAVDPDERRIRPLRSVDRPAPATKVRYVECRVFVEDVDDLAFFHPETVSAVEAMRTILNHYARKNDA